MVAKQRVKECHGNILEILYSYLQAERYIKTEFNSLERDMCAHNCNTFGLTGQLVGQGDCLIGVQERPLDFQDCRLSDLPRDRKKSS